MRLALAATLFLAILAPANRLLSQKGTKPQLVASSEPLSAAEERKLLHVPPGFAVELVAAEPNIRKPLNLTFDDRGRLWVTDTIEYPYLAKGKGRDSVKILEDTNGDGLYDKVTTFAEGLNIPVGVLPLPTRPGKRTAALVFSIPNIHRFTDHDGDDKADQDEVLYGSFGSKDTHGLTGSFTWGFDGWIYAHHGFANVSRVRGGDGSAIEMSSGNTYRLKADGSRVEQFTWGQVNPFGLSIDPLGDLYSADCHSRPAMLLLRGGYYPSFGKPHDGLGFAPELMSHDHGSTAICGISYYAADHFPAELRDTLFIGNVVTNRINHDKLERRGSTWRAIQQPDFLISDDPWFRPVDIRLGPDGALYIADFYNRIIGHYEVPLDHPGRDRERGRIWRIVYRGPDGKQKPSPIPDLPRADIKDLASYLAHPNLTLRLLATNQLLERDHEQVRQAVNGAVDSDNPLQRVQAMWALERLGRLGDQTLGRLARDSQAMVRVHAMRVLSERPELNGAERQLLWAGLKDGDGFVKRAAADALGRQPAADNLRPLLDERHAVPLQDLFLLHTVRMALRNQLRTEEAWTKLPQKLNEADRKAIADVTPGVPSPAAANFLIRHLTAVAESSDSQARYFRHAARYAASEQLPELFAFARSSRAEDLRHQAALVRAAIQGLQERGRSLAGGEMDWASAVTGKLLTEQDTNLLNSGIELAGLLKLRTAQETLAKLVRNAALPEAQRRSAASALVGIQPEAHVALLGAMLANAADPIGLREHAVTLLAGLNQPAARAELVKTLPAAPARLQNAVAFGLAGSPEGAKILLEAIEAGKASPRLLQERPVEVRLGQSQLPGLKERIAKLTANLPPADQRLQALIKTRHAGFSAAKADADLGAKIFDKHCANCHQVSNRGAKIGPQLDGLGQRGLDRILEDLVDPNRNVDQAFRTTTLTLKNGQFVSGLFLREEGEIAVMADPMGKEVRVPKKDIDERVLSNLSPMPANLVEQIPEAEFYHLLAFLLAQRQTPEKK